MEVTTAERKFRVFVFPGQGSQKRGMGADVFDRFPELVSVADAEMGISMRDLCLNDPESKLDQTQFTQPALYVVNALSYLGRLATDGRLPRYVAGHSLGEYSALFAAGVFDFATGLRLVKRRAELMAEARGGAMVAVVGKSEREIRQAMEQGGLDSFDVANLNTGSQVVLAGLERDVDRCLEVMNGTGAALVKRLNVSGAFHSRYMKEAGERFREALAHAEFAPPRIPVLSNVTARPHVAEEIRENLARQITHPVRWQEGIRWLCEQGEPEFTEVGPGNVLTGLIRRIQGEIRAEQGTGASVANTVRSA